MDQILNAELELFEAQDPEPVFPSTLLLKAQVPVDALMCFQQPV
jgi:hypothetical protein